MKSVVRYCKKGRLPKKMFPKCWKVFTLDTIIDEKCCKVLQKGAAPKENVPKVLEGVHFRHQNGGKVL